MVDKVKPLKIESSATGGTEDDMYPVEVDPAEDYVAAKGLSFENLDDYLIEKIGGLVKIQIPDHSQKVIYSGDNVSALEVFNGFTQTTPNRLARVDLTYTSDKVTSEVWKIYDPADGTTVLRTLTTTYTYSGDDLDKSELAET